jgi:hypothetical protein
MTDPASAVASRTLARLWIASEGAWPGEDAAEARAALRRLIPLWPREWAGLAIDDRARARVEARR